MLVEQIQVFPALAGQRGWLETELLDQTTQALPGSRVVFDNQNSHDGVSSVLFLIPI
jgi:hypothetical protein